MLGKRVRVRGGRHNSASHPFLQPASGKRFKDDVNDFSSSSDIFFIGYTLTSTLLWWKEKQPHVHSIDCRQGYILTFTLLTVERDTTLCLH